MSSILNITYYRQKKWPSLRESGFLRYFTFSVLYLAQGIPEGMLFYGIPAWLAMHGKTPGEIGSLIAMAGLPWSFKIIIAPFIDKFTYMPMGKRRPWIIFGQLGLVAAFINLALVTDPLHHLPALMWSVFLVSCFGCFQDVATDSMAVDVVPENQQARANGLMWGSKIAGISTSLALGSWLLNKFGFTFSIASLSVIIGMIMLVPVLIREKPGDKIFPWSKSISEESIQPAQSINWKKMLSSLSRVFLMKNSLILTIVFFIACASFSFVEAIFPIFTVQNLGWVNDTYAKFYASASLVGGIAGMLIGGILIDRFGKKRMLNTYFFLLIALMVGFVLLKTNWPNTKFIIAFLMGYQLLYVFSTIGLFASAMTCCWKKISATQFTLYMTIGNLGRVVGAKLIGPVKAHFSWDYTMLVFATLIAAAWLIMQVFNINTQKNKISALEMEEQRILAF